MTALESSEKVVATTRAKCKAAEFAKEFEAKRRELKSVPAVSKAASLPLAQRRKLADDYCLQRTADEPYARRKLLKRARADEASFWAGTIVPAPDDEVVLGGAPHSYWSDVCQDGETPVEHGLLYAVNFHHKKRLSRLKKQYDVGDCDDFILMAQRLAPTAAEEDREKLALDLLRAEIRALETIAARDEERLPAPPVAIVDAAASPLLSIVKGEWLAEKRKKDLREKRAIANCW